MTRKRKGLSFLCAVCAVVMMLSSCSRKKDDGKEESSEVPMVTYEAESYRIVRQQNASPELISVAVDFAERMSESVGVTMALSDGYLARGEEPDDNAPEILIGRTNRPQSDEAYTALGDHFGFSVARIGKKIVVAAPTAEMTEQALNYLLEEYIGKSAGDGRFSLPETLDYRSKEYDGAEIIHEGTPVYNVVYSMKASSGVADAAQSVYRTINSLSKTDTTLKNDWKRKDMKYDMSLYEVVIGDTGYDRSKELKAQSKYSDWKMEMADRKIYLYASAPQATEAVCGIFNAALKKAEFLDERGTVKMISFESKAGATPEWMNEIPEYTGGNTEKILEFADGMYQIYVSDTTDAEYGAYRGALEGAGYVLYAENQIGKNRYATYTGGESVVHAYWLDAQKTVRILISEKVGTELFPKDAVEDAAVCDPLLTQMDMDYESQFAKDNGMGFIFTLRDGSYIIIDGGYATETETLYRFLRDNNKRADGKILIRAWMISHPHLDHYGNFVEFSKTHALDVTLERMIGHPAKENLTDNGGSYREWQNNILLSLKNFAGAKLVVPLTGQKMMLGNVEFEFYYTPEMMYPEEIADSNNTSLACRITFEGQTILLPGDAQRSVVSLLVENYGEALKSDFVQAPHHGLSGGSKAFYALVDPSYVFFATAQDKYEERIKSDYAANSYLLHELHVKECFVADGGYHTLRFPFRGSGYIERDYSDQPYDSEHLDRIGWDDLNA